MEAVIARQHLPLPAKCALEYLDAQGEGNRTIGKLDGYLAHYHQFYGLTVDPMVRYSCHQIVLRRYELTGSDALGAMERP